MSIVFCAKKAGTGRSAILGALVGDALGVPFEFKGGHEIPFIIDMTMPASFPKSHGGIPYGTWSDDGAQLLCLLESLLLHQSDYNAQDFANRLIQWHDHGRHQSGGRVFDCGLQTASALDRIRNGISPEQSGSRDDRANGNGSLMRVLSVAVAAHLFDRDDSWVIQAADAQSLPTHGHEKSRACCAVYALLAHKMMDGAPPDPQPAFEAVADHYQNEPAMQKALADIRTFGTSEIPNGRGYVINSFWSALYALGSANSYTDAVIKAIKLGNDTDTTACIAGGLAGIRWGIGGNTGIPHTWLAALHVPEESRSLVGLELFVNRI